ncbi:MAG: hypothetical protein KBH07_05365 [Flavobacteriales bacterium]|nr:hypothetical protein [Flavobacteriales bacterium]
MHHIIKIVAAIMVVATGCTKEGPEGPSGAAGPQGNANVHVDTIAVQPGSWNVANPDWLWYQASLAAITADIYHQGTVITYIANGGGSEGPGWQVDPTATYFIGMVMFNRSTVNGQQPDDPIRYKVVSIAGTGMVPVGLDVNDHSAVCNYFGLPR